MSVLRLHSEPGWNATSGSLDTFGCATLADILTPDECAELIGMYRDEAGFRKRVVMAQHGFGRGEYKYFAYPLPPLVAQLRETLYPPLAEIANR